MMSEPDKMFFDEAFLRRLERLSLVYRSAARSRRLGERRSTDRGGSLEFADFRPYTLGDDFRRVDWNAYARLERLFIKLYQEEQQVSLYLLVDNSPSMDWGTPNKLEYACRLAAALGYIGLLGLDRLLLAPLSNDNHLLPPFNSFYSKRAAFQLFSECRNIKTSYSSENASSRFSELLSSVSRPGIFAVFSDLFDPTWQTAVGRLLDRGHQIIVFNILAPDEIDPLFEGEFRLVDAEGGPPVEITADFETLRAYRSSLDEWQNEWTLFCSKRSSSYLPVSTSLPLEELLFSKMQQAGVLK